MTPLVRRGSALVLFVLAARPLHAQAPPIAAETGHATPLGAEFQHEGSNVAAACGLEVAALHRCPIELFTDHPVHVAVGSLAPQNGFGVGAAFTHQIPAERTTQSWNADAVRAFGGAWRAGVYYKLVLTPVTAPHSVDIDAPGASSTGNLTATHPYPVVDVYAQTTSLTKLLFFGLGPNSLLTNKTAFGMRQTVAGARTIYPLTWPAISGWNLAAIGEAEGRFVSLPRSTDGALPQVADRYTDADAPGISSQPAFLQSGEGIRARPTLFHDRLQLDYAAVFRQYHAPSNRRSSFRRWTVDLDHEVRLTKSVLAPATRDTHGPDDCSVDLGDSPCPKPSFTRNQYGTAGVHLYASGTSVGSGSAVPFYFQPTLGGSDIDGTRWLAAYQDYRFRGPSVVAIRETVEHYLYAMIGLSAIFEQGAVGLGQGAALGAVKHSVAVGVSLRLGGLPMAHVLWGTGTEGHRFIAVVNASLLGGSNRPSAQ